MSDSYVRRVVDDELDALIPDLPALSIDGARGVGKTRTAEARASAVFRLDTAADRERLDADPDALRRAEGLVVVDEWQHYPSSWDLVRRAVDDEQRPGRFLLTGSPSYTTPPTHSGAGRIVALRMRPMSLFERGVSRPTVSVAALLSGQRPTIDGQTDVSLPHYVDEIVMSGFPGVRSLSARGRRRALDSYLDQIVDRDVPDAGLLVRRPEALRRWLEAYGAATSTLATFERIRDAATAGDAVKMARTTAQPYRDTLERLRVLDPVSGWAPTRNHLQRLTFAPKHHLVDPALAVAAAGLDADALLGGLGGEAVREVRDGTFLGALFESLVTLDVRVYAQASEARVHYFRTKDGREVDLVVAHRGRVLAVEVKLSSSVRDDDVKHLRWLQDRLGADLLDAVVVNTGEYAYRRKDGIAVVPLALLGP